MQSFTYLAALVFSLFGLGILDRRYQLALWHDARRTLKTIAGAGSVFIVWDLAGIGLGIFRHGNGPYSLPARIMPEFPLEELFFIVLLCYTTLLVYRGIERWSR